MKKKTLKLKKKIFYLYTNLDEKKNIEGSSDLPVDFLRSD